MALRIGSVFEPTYRSHEFIEALSDLLDTFDGVGRDFPESTESLATNLDAMALLASTIAAHVRKEGTQ